jgi:lipoyl(octanoyl) transferase
VAHSVAAPPSLEVYLLGTIEFPDAQLLQRRLVYDLGERGGAALVLCEHPPTISVGRSGSRLHIVPDDDGLRALAVRTYWVNRGGGCWLHLPGQLAIYLAVPLKPFGLDVGAYLGRLHRLAVDVLAEFDLAATTMSELPGVFLGYSRVATVGVAVSRWIAYHGLTLNVGPYLEPFELILDEPGLNGWPLRQTSMEARRQRQAPMAKVREAVVRHVESLFKIEHQHVYTSHPLIRPKVAADVYAASPG